jgi:hypothetical protein
MQNSGTGSAIASLTWWDAVVDLVLKEFCISLMGHRIDALDAALHYSEKGWPVFPLAPRSKHPLIPARDGGRGLHDATTDAAVIQAWWEAHPTANVRLRTGVAFDVIDLDGPSSNDE